MCWVSVLSLSSDVESESRTCMGSEIQRVDAAKALSNPTPGDGGDGGEEVNVS